MLNKHYLYIYQIFKDIQVLQSQINTKSLNIVLELNLPFASISNYILSIKNNQAADLNISNQTNKELNLLSHSFSLLFLKLINLFTL